jgi:hypothetical protein
MICLVYRRKRNSNGKTQLARLYRGRYRLDNEPKITDVPLNTPDKRVAQQRLEQMVKEKQMREAKRALKSAKVGLVKTMGVEPESYAVLKALSTRCLARTDLPQPEGPMTAVKGAAFARKASISVFLGSWTWPPMRSGMRVMLSRVSCSRLLQSLRYWG